MPGKSSADVFLDASPGSATVEAVAEEDRPFQIVVLGDFSGRSGRGELADRRPVVIDRDNFDEVMDRLGAELELPGAGCLRFRSLDDFHPDRLFGELELLREPEEIREEKPVVEAPPPPPARDPDLGLDGLLDAAIEETESTGEAGHRRPKDELRAWVDEQVAPHLEKPPSQREADARASMERSATERVREVLHAPAFQALEAAWRALFFMVRRVETGPNLKIYLVDASLGELAADLNSVKDPRESGIGKLLAGSPGEERWSLVVGNYTFGGEKNLALLARLGLLAVALEAPLLAAGHSSLAGCDSLAETPNPSDWNGEIEEAWVSLRKTALAPAIGLVLPRFLLRLPYGADTEPCEAFDFEEAGETPEHDSYLWGNSAIACATLLAQSFAEHGWEFHPGQRLRVDGLPLHVYRCDSEAVAKPCAEFLLSERAAERLLESGLMPLVSFRDSDMARLLRFQSIADPPTALSAWWG